MRGIDLSIVKCFAGLFEAYKHIMRIGGTDDKQRFFVRKVLFTFQFISCQFSELI